MLDSIAYVINAIWGVFTSIGLNDIVDIAILSFLIFHGIKLIRETRAQQLHKRYPYTYRLLPACSIL